METNVNNRKTEYFLSKTFNYYDPHYAYTEALEKRDVFLKKNEDLIEIISEDIAFTHTGNGGQSLIFAIITLSYYLVKLNHD